jgi:2-hydroxy-3-keto-5-methylthiopentenyl-1-phosphate phosphatase
MKIAVLADFDGTLTNVNVLETLYWKFGAPSCQEVVKRWDRGEISTMDEIYTCFSTFNATRVEMEDALRNIRVDPAIHQFLFFCRERGYPFAIVSDGLRWYIEFILKDNGIPNVTIYANEIEFVKNGFKFSFPWYDGLSPLRGVSKAKVVQSFQMKDYQVVFIGDGLSDTDAIHAADIVYARDGLLEYARLIGIVAKEFNGLSDIVNNWET